VSYLAGIHDLAYCFSRVGGAADSGVRQDWVGLGANIGALAGKAVWYAKGQSAALKTALEATGKKILPTPTAIIDVTMVAVVVIDLMNGFGAPDSGSGFSSGVDKLKIVDGKLELAIPDSRDWSGSAADAYAAQNAALRALVANMVKGVTDGYEKKLTLVGVGFRAQAAGDKVNLSLGFSHPVVHMAPKGVKIETPVQTEILVKGIDKQQVGQVAAELRAYRPPEPYKGKGVRYFDEHVKIKETKKK